MYHKPALASPMFSVCQHQYVSLWSNSDSISHNSGCSLSSLASHEASGRDYSTLKGDLSEWWLQGCYVTLQGPSTWPQGSPVFRLASCLPPPRAQCHSAAHGHAGDTSNCSGDQGRIFSGSEEELCKWYEEDVGIWREETAPRWAHSRLTNAGLAVEYHAHCAYLLFLSWLGRCMSTSYTPRVGAEKQSRDCICADTSAESSVKQGERKNAQTCGQDEEREEDRGSERGDRK